MATDYDYIFGEKQTERQTVGKTSFLQIILVVAVIALIAVTAFLMGIMFERRTNPANSTEMASFWQVWDILEKDYYAELPTAEDRRYAAIEGLVTSLQDPFTSFARPRLAEERRQQIDGHFGGIGVTIGIIDGNYRREWLGLQEKSLFDKLETVQGMCEMRFCTSQVAVQSILPGNPAEAAGLESGDLFIGVDGDSVEGVSTTQLAEKVRGEIGTPVQLKMYRPSTEALYDAPVIRAIIETPTVQSQNIDGVAYLSLASFNGVATSQLEEHLKTFEDQDIHGIILDLRGNGGGLLSQAMSVADLFLDDGVVLVQRSKTDEETLRSTDGQYFKDIPMIVLVDQNTASASEVVAGALRDRQRAILIGQQTFGKGVVQLVYNLTDGSQLRVTSTTWYTPNDIAIHGEGLKPDIIIVPPTITTVNPNGTTNTDVPDPVLDAALDYLK